MQTIITHNIDDRAAILKAVTDAYDVGEIKYPVNIKPVDAKSAKDRITSAIANSWPAYNDGSV